MGKSTISMAMLNRYVKLPEANLDDWGVHPFLGQLHGNPA
jgi:hypothetical protein